MLRSDWLMLGLVSFLFGAAALVLFLPSPESAADFRWDSIGEDQTTEADVIRLLGPPAATVPAPFAQGQVLVYPIRSGWFGYSHAPVLRIEFDSAGVVQNMGYFQPQTGEHLPLREKPERARKKLSCGRSIVDGTHFGVRPEVALEQIRVGHSGREDVSELLAAFEPPPSMLTVPFPRKTPTGSGETWEYYVDGPRPLFIPSRLEARVYLYSDGVKSKGLQRGFSGCVT